MAVTNQANARRQLDRRFERLRPLAAERPPHRGWIRAIRDALGMSTTELAGRLGVRQQTVLGLERSEVNESIKLATLRRVADALGCDVAYVLVPRRPLEQAASARAREKAAALLAPVAHHARLEDQAVDDRATDDQIDDLAAQLVDRRGLWSDSR